MTNEEVVEFGNMWLQINEDCKDSNTYAFFQMAIKALEQQPCEDCISRQAVKSIMARWKFNSMNAYLEADYEIDKLPSVTQNQKTGHWVKIGPYHMQQHEYKCSECYHETDDNTENYCSECGARME